MEQLKSRIKESKRGAYFYWGLSLVPLIIGAILFLSSLNESFSVMFRRLQICFFLFGICAIIIGLGYKYNKNYYRTTMFKVYGDAVDKYISRTYKIFIVNGCALIILSIIGFLLLIIFS